MSEPDTLLPAVQEDLYSLLIERMRPMLLRALESAGPGHRLRVTTLPEPVMQGVCRSLQDDERWVARVLATVFDSSPWKATATKLIELRNTLEKPLLVFIPPGLRTAAEDSLDIATFTELSLATLTQDLAEAVLSQVPAELDDRVIYLDAANRERPPGLNLLDVALFPERETACSHAASPLPCWQGGLAASLHAGCCRPLPHPLVWSTPSPTPTRSGPRHQQQQPIVGTAR